MNSKVVQFAVAVTAITSPCIGQNINPLLSTAGSYFEIEAYAGAFDAVNSRIVIGGRSNIIVSDDYGEHFSSAQPYPANPTVEGLTFINWYNNTTARSRWIDTEVSDNGVEIITSDWSHCLARPGAAVSTHTVGQAPSICKDGSNIRVFFWDAMGGAGQDSLYSVESYDCGASFTPSTLVSADDVFDDYDIFCHSATSQNRYDGYNYHVAYSKKREVTPYDIRHDLFYRNMGSGTNKGTPINLSSSLPSDEQSGAYKCSIAGDGGSRLLVVWAHSAGYLNAEDSGIYCAYSSNNGNSWSSPIRLAYHNWQYQAPVAAYSPATGFVVAFAVKLPGSTDSDIMMYHSNDLSSLALSYSWLNSDHDTDSLNDSTPLFIPIVKPYGAGTTSTLIAAYTTQFSGTVTKLFVKNASSGYQPDVCTPIITTNTVFGRAGHTLYGLNPPRNQAQTCYETNYDVYTEESYTVLIRVPSLKKVTVSAVDTDLGSITAVEFRQLDSTVIDCISDWGATLEWTNSTTPDDRFIYATVTFPDWSANIEVSITYD